MRILPVVAALAALVLVFAPDLSADESDGRIELAAALEPADLAPGQSGTLVVRATLFEDLHIYAEDGDWTGMTWKPVPVEGVTYDVEKAELTKPHLYTEPTFGDEFMVFTKAFVLRVPVRLSSDVAPDAALGVTFDYTGCTEEMCYTPIEGHAVTARLGAAAGGSGAGDPAAKPSKPKISPPVMEESVTISLRIDEAAGKAIVSFQPGIGWWLYLRGAQDGDPIRLEPVEAEGVTWGAFEIPAGEKQTMPLDIEIPFQRAEGVAKIGVQVHWAACNDMTCLLPEERLLEARWDGASAAPPPPVPAPEVVQGKEMFPVVRGEELNSTELNEVQKLFDRIGWFVLGPIFLFGVLLAFTPCVLPIIPITVSVVSGGRADLPKSRLSVLLLTYVAGLACAFGVLGLIAAYTGENMSVAFENPGVIWGIAALFVFLSIGMFGVVELQPPQWLQRIQSGTQRKGGSVPGAFLLGGLGAVIASPCTGPFIVGMVVFTAQAANPVLGFLMFATLGLGMGAVFFAAGSLNFMMRPGPWMVWVRYGFGVMLMGVALYYLAHQELLTPMMLFVAGFVLAMGSWFLVTRHLIEKEGEDPGPARIRGAKVAVMLIVATGLVALITRPEVVPAHLQWTKLDNTDDLVRRVRESTAEGKPVAVKVTAKWCTNCHKYDAVILDSEKLRLGFSKLTRLKIDVTESSDQTNALRDALGIPRGAQPYIVFIDGDGRILRGADIRRWESEAESELQERLDLVLGGSVEAAGSTETAEG